MDQPLTFNSLPDFERLCVDLKAKGLSILPEEKDGALSIEYVLDGKRCSALYIPRKKTPFETFDLQKYINNIRKR